MLLLSRAGQRVIDIVGYRSHLKAREPALVLLLDADSRLLCVYPSYSQNIPQRIHFFLLCNMLMGVYQNDHNK
jgi:hypothetical protein